MSSADEYMKLIDYDFTEQIDYLEFLTVMFNYKKHLNNDLIKTIFDVIDTDKNGKISEKELGQFFKLNDE